MNRPAAAEQSRGDAAPCGRPPAPLSNQEYPIGDAAAGRVKDLTEAL